MRKSNIELYRIIVMFLIVAHHYVVNSGLPEAIDAAGQKSLIASIFLSLWGAWGKTGINCFVLITGYFMCDSRITVKKFVKLLFQVWFYNIVISLCFVMTGMASLSKGVMIHMLFPVRELRQDFVPCFIVFYLFIPFINMFVKQLGKHQFQLFLGLTIGMFCLVPSSHVFVVDINYVTWFSIVYMIGAYIRLYGQNILDYKWRKVRLYGLVGILGFCFVTIVGAGFVCADVLFCMKPIMMSLSNRVLSLGVAIVSFIFFLSLNIPQNKIINNIASTTFGILLIHGNSHVMRQWLWGGGGVMNNVNVFNNSTSAVIVCHAICVTLVVFSACSLIDFMRIKFIERPFFNVIWPRLTMFFAAIIRARED